MRAIVASQRIQGTLYDMHADSIRQVIRFVIAGTTAAASNIAVLYILVQYFSIFYLTASIISFLASVAVGFTLQKFWAFRDTNTEHVHIQLVKYALITITNLCVNVLLMYVLVSLFDVWYLGAQIISGACIAVISYTCNSIFVFARHNETHVA